MSWSNDDEPTVISGPDAPPPGTRDEGGRLTDGQVLGPYRIERLLERGGMGEVYEAEHLEHGRRVALKVLNKRLAGADDHARFLREGQLAAALAVGLGGCVWAVRNPGRGPAERLTGTYVVPR